MKSMFRLVFIYMICIFLWSGQAMAVTTCPSKPAGKVNIIWSSDAVKYDFSKSQSQMNRMETDTENPYDRSIKTHVGGLMSGGISIKSEINVATITYPRSRVSCQWIDKMDVRIAIDPTIFIAREHGKGSCKHNAILQHEMKHVYVDRTVVKKYAPAIKRHLEQSIRKVGIVGPKAERRAPHFQQKIIDYMDGQLKAVTSKMYEERRIKQQGIDTLEEYERVSNLCR
jgi:hypothetical protein